MQIITTITQKGQITIPKYLRDKYRIEEYTKVTIEEENDHLKIIPTKDILDLAGIFKPKKKKSVLKARRAFETNYNRI